MEGESLIKFVRGTPTAEEIAALVGALLATRPAPDPGPPVGSRWARAARPTRLGQQVGPGAWSASARPR